MGDISLGMQDTLAVRLWIAKWNLRVTFEQKYVLSKPEIIDNIYAVDCSFLFNILISNQNTKYSIN